MYYDFRKIDSFNCFLNIVLSRRGLGKTFGRILRCVKRFKKSKKRFIYVVETREMVKELARNNGDKFFAGVVRYLKDSRSKKDKELLDFIEKGTKLDTDEDKYYSGITGSTILIGGECAGYIVAFNDFANLKRNNFDNVSEVIIDEFIPESIDIRTLKNPYKFVSVIQSIARTRDIKIYMLANSIRLSDPTLTALGLNNLKLGEFRFLKDEYGIFGCCHYVDNKEYNDFSIMADKSVAGRFAKIMGHSELDENIFKTSFNEDLMINGKIKASRLVACFHTDLGSFRLHISKDTKEFYCLYDYGNNINNRFCFNKKLISPTVKYNCEFKEALEKLYENKAIKFDSLNTFLIFCDLLKINA